MAIEPVTGDAVFVERWETANDGQGNLDLEDLGAPVRANRPTRSGPSHPQS